MTWSVKVINQIEDTMTMLFTENHMEAARYIASAQDKAREAGYRVEIVLEEVAK